MRTIGRIIIVFICLIQLPSVLAQNNTDSPYSRFGIGKLSRPGFDNSRAMGSIGLGVRVNNQLNYLNPASFTAMDTLSFLFDFGINARRGEYQTTDLSQTSKNANIDHMAIGFPFTRWWKSSVGIMPYSSVGYNIKEISFVQNAAAVDYLYSGTGGLNRLYMGTAMEFFKRVSLGINFSYIFGTTEIEKGVDFPYRPDFSQAKSLSRTVVKGFIYNFGLQYYQTFADDYHLTLGVIFDNERSLRAENTKTITNIFPGSAAVINDSTLLNPEFILQETVENGVIDIPSNFGAGFTFSYQNKVMLGFDYYQQDWSNSSFLDETDMFTLSNSYHLGIQVTPDAQAMKGYWKRIRYRIGGHHKNSYLQLKGYQLSDSGISFGLGLPFKGTRSSFNMACNIGQRGTLDYDLVREQYIFLSFSVTLHDFWFLKRQFD